MNGRVYDYNLGKFMSVDPFIVTPTNSQSFNPYSYIMNNPLSGTDPSGYSSQSVQVETEPPQISETIADTVVAEIEVYEEKKVNLHGGRLKSTVKTKVGTIVVTNGASSSKTETAVQASQVGQPAASGSTSEADSSASGSISHDETDRLNSGNEPNGAGANQTELSFWDNLGRRLPTAPQGLVDFVAGFGDSLSFNITKHIRSLADIESVDTDSDTYNYGNTTGTVFGLVNAGRSGLQVYSGIKKAKQWRSNSRTSRQTRARKIAAAGSYRQSASDAVLTVIGGSGLDSYVSIVRGDY